MKTSPLSSLKIRNGLILIGVMVPLFILFLSYDVSQQSAALRKALTERGIILAQTGAAATGKIFEDAIKSRRLLESQVFDTRYQPIPGTNPQKYHTEYDYYADENLRVIEDSYLKDKVIVYAVASMSMVISQHIMIGTLKWGGLNFDRSKRIFDDEVGIDAARNKSPYKFQEYSRDTGEVMWDISAPIYVNGRHWGAFRIGFSIEETNKQITTVVRRMVFAGVFLTVALIAIAFYLSNRISNRVKLIAGEANRVAQGDLSLSDLIFDSRDEVGTLGRSFTNMVIKLRELAGKTQYSAKLIANYTGDLLRSTEHVAEDRPG